MFDNHKIIFNLTDLLRRTNTQKSFPLLLQLFALAKLTSDSQRSKTLNLGKIPLTLEELKNSLNALSKNESLGQCRQAFQPLNISIDDKTILDLWHQVQELGKQGLLANFKIDNSTLKSIFGGYGMFIFSDELINFMTEILGSLKGKTIYCPQDNLGQLSRQAYSKGGTVTAEVSAGNANDVMLIDLINGTEINLAIGDPIVSPSFTENGKLTKFNLVFSFPPFGVKYDRDIRNKDLFSRFPEKTSRSSILSIRQVLSQTKDRAIVAVPQNILFSGGAELALRKDLVEQNLIEAVVNMPSALLSTTNIPFALLIFNKQKKSKKIRFFDIDNEQFYSRDGRGRSTLNNGSQLVEAFQNETDTSIAADIPIKTVIERGYSWQTSQYLSTPEQQYIDKHLLTNQTTACLEELVEFIRPLKPSKNGTISVKEAMIADFPEYGYLPTLQREVMVFFGKSKKKDLESFLQPYDIILSTKGNVGKVALVSENCPPPGKDGWIANQSCLILRSNGKVDPRFLFAYLRSDLGQYLIKSMVVGASVSLIQLKMLEQLTVILSSEEDVREVISTFCQQTKIQSQIQKLQAEQHSLAESHWRIPTAVV